MALPNVIAAKAALELFTAAEFNAELKANLEYVDDQAVVKHGCLLRSAAAQSMITVAQTFLTFDTETEDTDNYHSLVSNTDRITIPTGYGGIYVVEAYVQHASQGQIGLSKTSAGVTTCLTRQSQAAASTGQCYWSGPLLAADYLRVWFYNFGATSNTVIAAGDAALQPPVPHVSCYKVG